LPGIFSLLLMWQKVRYKS